ncbi:MAG: type II secretion system GspH family protein [Patescibacteria group bacterium]|nr:type II secretion system GspH family protein [Patescibacteria group bacterium]
MKNFYRNNYQQWGFTLVELLISLTIIAIVSVIGFTNLTGTREKMAVNLEVEKIATYLRSVRDRAIAGEDDSSWGVRFVNNVSGDDVYYSFKGLSFSSTSIVETRFLSKKTQLAIPAVGSTTDIIFVKGSGSVVATSTIRIQSRTNQSFFGDIQVNSRGLVNY